MAKIARVQVSKQWFEYFLRGEFGLRPNTVISSNAPKDLEVIGLYIPENKRPFPIDVLEVYVKSESFKDIPNGIDYPLIEPFLYTITELNG